jgi:pSer/pThr/pTyr-binding forkhead associated (FHA) protein
MPPLPETPPLPVENKDEHEIAASPVEPVAAAASVQADEVKVSAEAAAARDSVKPVEGTAATNERPARLVLRSNSGDVIHEYELTKLVLSVGRASHNDIILPKDKLTSRHHVTLRREGDQWSILDEQSANGTYVDDKKIAASTPHELRDGSKIRIGVHRLVFHAQYQPISNLEDMPTIVDEYSTRQDEALAVAAASEPDELNVSAFYPHTVAAEKWNTLLVYMHLESVIDTIYKDAGRHKLSIAQTPPKTGAQSQTPQLPEPKVTLVPDFQGMMFNPKRMTFTWSEAWKRSVFRFIAKKELLGTTTHGKVSVFIGPLLVATLNVAIRCEQQTGKGKDYDTEVTTRLYKRIYAAYSPEDALVAQAYQDVYKLPGFEFLEKVDKLRSNNTFNDEQKRMLEQAEVFQLFWSAHAKDSAALAEEWQYALQQQKGEDFVRPVYWEIPLVPPSKDLAALQFTYIPEYTFAESSSKIASISTSSSKSVPAVKAEPASKDIPVAKAEPVSKDVPPAKEDQPAKETSSPRDELPSKDEAVSKDEVSAKDEPVLDPPVLKEEKAAKDEPVLEEEKAIEDKPVSKDEISPKEKPVLKEEKATRDEPASAQEVLSKDEAILDQHPTEDEPVSEDDAL